MNGKEAAEMPGCGRRWKTKSRFSIAAHEPLEIAGPRFPHSRSPGHYRHGKVEIQTQDSHFPTAHSSLKIKNERRTQPPPVTLVFRLISGLENARSVATVPGDPEVRDRPECGRIAGGSDEDAAFRADPGRRDDPQRFLSRMRLEERAAQTSMDGSILK
jgi:hypothetical protein